MNPQKTYSRKRCRCQHTALAILLLLQVAFCGCARQKTGPYPATMFAPTENPQMPLIESGDAPATNSPADLQSTPQNQNVPPQNYHSTTQPATSGTTQQNLRPGDLIDVKKIRNNERTLGAAQIFAGGQGNTGPPPKIVVRTPDTNRFEPMAE